METTTINMNDMINDMSENSNENSNENIDENIDENNNESILLTSDNLPTDNFIHDSINSTLPIDYISENPQWNTMMCSNTASINIPSQRIEMLNMFMNNNDTMDDNVKKIHKIHYDLIQSNNNINYTADKQDKDIIHHEKLINENMSSFYTLIEEFQKQNDLLLTYEKEYKDNYEKSQLDIRKITDFKDFIISIHSKYKDLDSSELSKLFLKTIQNIEKDNKLKECNTKYLKQNYITNLYLNRFIKRINGCNMGSTCSLCLQRQVDTFMEPCGHTACSECVNELKERNGEYTCNCFLCRKKIFKFHKLYFT